MRHTLKSILLVLFLAACSFASLTVHIQSPWRDDPTKDDYVLHILGGTTSHNAQFGANSVTAMLDEGDHWFSYTWNQDISNIPDWENFSVLLFPNTDDQNFNNKNSIEWDELEKTNIVGFFGNETELWLYTDPSDLSYTTSFIAPNSKIVWFKSPWGNKALPQMILGQDSVLMRFAIDDKSTCGWFYGALSPEIMKRNPLQSVYFIRYKTPYMTIPESGLVQLGDSLSKHDTIFVDGTAAGLPITNTIGSLGTCFDSSYVLHFQHPWRTNTSYQNSNVYVSVDNNVINPSRPQRADNKGEYESWWHYSFSPTTVKSAAWNSSSALLNIHRQGTYNSYVAFFDNSSRPEARSLFPAGVYEAWLYTTSDGSYDISWTPLEPKVIRLMSPWDDMAPSMIINGEMIKMSPILANSKDSTQSDTCGWYQGTYYKHTELWDVQFRQSFGMEYYSLEGLMGENKGMGRPIALDSMMELHDTVWVYPYPLATSGPKFSNTFPGRLGICPTMKISAMVVDWAGEAYDDSIDIDFGKVYQGNKYTVTRFINANGKLDSNNTCNGLIKGMVQDTLVNGKPARADSLNFPWKSCGAAHEIERWFTPEVVATDKNGKKYTNAVCRDIDLKMDEEGFWLADITQNGCKDPNNPGFYPIDDLEYLDDAKTVKNPKYDKILNEWGSHDDCWHNYSYAMKISAEFQYIKGQYFEFRGDDDVWVFINRRLVVDIGGVHTAEEGAVNLDTIGQNDPRYKLEEGKTYSFHIFYSERNRTDANFKMRTSINLRTQKTYFPVEKPNTTGRIEYDLFQLVTDKSLSCDLSATSKVDTTYAPSVFRLVGGNLPAEGVLLDPGLNHGGIFINDNMTGFWIDTTGFVNSRTLSPGTYVLICYLASDLKQYQMIRFTVPEYPLPNVEFVDVFHLSNELFLNPKGLTLRGDSLGANGGINDTLWAHAIYPDTIPLQVTLAFGNTPCGDLIGKSDVMCKEKLIFKTTFPITFLDENFQPIDTLKTDSLGYAKFYVVGDSTMQDAFFTISGTGVANELRWEEIHFKDPPVPIATRARMYDVDGNGVPDSLVIPFSKAFKDVVPDTLTWIFGGGEEHTTAGMDNVWPYVKKDSILVLYDKKGLRKDVFTGIEDKVYTGSLVYHYSYIDEDSGEEVKLILRATIEDKVAPIITKATIKTVSSNSSMIEVLLSEGIDPVKIDPQTAFEFFRGKQNFMDSLRFSGADLRENGNMVRIYFQRSENGVLPAVGDSIRLAPGILKDRSNNAAHRLNPKVRIEGDQRTDVKSPGLVLISDDMPEWPYKEPTIPLIVPTDMTIRDVIDSLGMPGFLLSYNIGELATSVLANLPEGADKDSALAEIKIKWEIHYFTHLADFVNHAKGTVSCSDTVVFYNAADPGRSNCHDNPGNVFFEWNARSENGRLVGTGPYISKMQIKIYVGKNVVGKNMEVYTLGIRRQK